MFHLNSKHSTRNFITASAEQEMHVSDPQFWWCYLQKRWHINIMELQ